MALLTKIENQDIIQQLTYDAINQPIIFSNNSNCNLANIN